MERDSARAAAPPAGRDGWQDEGVTVAAHVKVVAFDAPDIEALAAFYAELTGWEIVHREPDWIVLRAGDGQRLALQLAPDHRPPRWPGQEAPQQFHLDLMADDYEATADRAVALGAVRLATGRTWTTLADPAGHPFDLCRREGAPTGTVDLFAVAIDAPDCPAMARFYSALLGMPVVYSGAEGALVEGQGRRLMFHHVSGYQAPRWPDPDYPQQGHLDIAVADLDEGEARVLALGATSLHAGDADFRVFADPAGHPFCLVLPAASA